MMQYVVFALLISACVYNIECSPYYNPYETAGYGGYQPPRNTFGKLIVRNKNNNENENDESVDNENGVDSANANAQRDLRSKSNEKYDINRRNGYDSDGYGSDGYDKTYASSEDSGSEYEPSVDDRY